MSSGLLLCWPFWVGLVVDLGCEGIFRDKTSFAKMQDEDAM